MLTTPNVTTLAQEEAHIFLPVLAYYQLYHRNNEYTLIPSINNLSRKAWVGVMGAVPKATGVEEGSILPCEGMLHSSGFVQSNLMLPMDD